MPVAPAIPYIASGIATAYGAWRAHKDSQQAQQQAQPLIDAQTGLAKQQAGQGKDLFNFGMPQLQKAAGYYGSLLTGNRAAVQTTLAPTIAQMSDVYKGAERNLSRQAPGAGRDEASAALSAQRAGQIGMLPIQARAGAAEAVANLGQTGVSGGTASTNAASGIYGNLLGDQFRRQEASNAQQYQLGQNLSKILGDFLKAWKERNAGAGPGYPAMNDFYRYGNVGPTQ
jgi:alpha-D-ribose 1-methylphosphonate 5-triphosphate synthase subunit PhnG